MTKKDLNPSHNHRGLLKETFSQKKSIIHAFVSATGGVAIASSGKEADPSTTTPLPSADTPLKKELTISHPDYTLKVKIVTHLLIKCLTLLRLTSNSPNESKKIAWKETIAKPLSVC